MQILKPSKIIKALHYLFVLSSKKDITVDTFQFLIGNYDVSTTTLASCYLYYYIFVLNLQVSMLPEDAARMLPQCSAPRIGRFIVEDGEPFYYIFVEQKPLLQCQSLFKAF